MKKRDILLVLALIILAAPLFLFSRFGKSSITDTPQAPFITPAPVTDTSTAPQPQLTEAVEPAGTAAPTLAPADCYLLITVGDVVFEPYPMLEERDLPITQVDGKKNVVHLTTRGFHMADATCENHDCVEQGEVTLDNRDVRILGNMVVCLPNQVMLQLLTPEEARVVWENAHGKESE